MAMRDILVQLRDDAPSRARLALAAEVAARQGAHLTGLFVVDVPLPVFAGADGSGGAAVADLLGRLREDALAEGARIQPGFTEALRQHGVVGEWRQAEGPTIALLPRHARYADLVILGQPAPEDPAAGFAAVEATLFASGRPLLLVPHIGVAAPPGRRVVIGWNASREAARAVHDALPLMAGAAAVTVVVINPADASGTHGEEPGADIARHLARHGLPVTVRALVGEEIAAGELLLNAAADLGADLIVMGGYGHSRLREWALGGATRMLLRAMTAPVLMSH